MRLISVIKECIEQQLDKGNTRFIIFPFGEIGMQVNNILKDVYNITAAYILDNHLNKYNSTIKPLTFLEEIDCEQYVLILASTNSQIYCELKQKVLEYFAEQNIAEFSSMRSFFEKKECTKVGKYSYGPLCNHWLVERVGAFCSFALGSDVVVNHARSYLSTHPFIYYGGETNDVYDKPYGEYKDLQWYFEGVIPKGTIEKCKKIRIGNDVWLGRNVIITNGVIAGAGAVITKDVPDYAVVAGVPARIIRYRYTPEQIDALNKIQWWNWSDDIIRERYDDFYLPIEEFITKYRG